MGSPRLKSIIGKVFFPSKMFSGILCTVVQEYQLTQYAQIILVNCMCVLPLVEMHYTGAGNPDMYQKLVNTNATMGD